MNSLSIPKHIVQMSRVAVVCGQRLRLAIAWFCTARNVPLRPVHRAIGPSLRPLDTSPNSVAKRYYGDKHSARTQTHNTRKKKEHTFATHDKYAYATGYVVAIVRTFDMLYAFRKLFMACKRMPAAHTPNEIPALDLITGISE